jgi:hypothetical protein
MLRKANARSIAAVRSTSSSRARRRCWNRDAHVLLDSIEAMMPAFAARHAIGFLPAPPWLTVPKRFLLGTKKPYVDGSGAARLLSYTGQIYPSGCARLLPKCSDAQPAVNAGRHDAAMCVSRSSKFVSIFGSASLIGVSQGSGQLRPYVRPSGVRRLPLAIMGVRFRVRHQSSRRAQSTCFFPVLPELRNLDRTLPITLFSASCRISRTCARRLPLRQERHAAAPAVVATRPFAW